MLPETRQYFVNKHSINNNSWLTRITNGRSYQWILAFLCSSVFLEYGFHVGWVSPMKKVLQSDASPVGVSLTDVEISFVACTSTLAGVVGVPICTYIAEVYGRKVAVVTIMLLYAVSWNLKLLATHNAVLMGARIIGGVSLGGSFIVVPMYIREISQDSLRGTLVSLALSSQHVGVLAMYAMGSYLSYNCTLWIALCISIVAISCMPIAPESPAFLVKMEKFEEAKQVLANLRGLQIDDVIIQNEINYLENVDSNHKTDHKMTLATIFKNKSWRRGYFLCQILFCCIPFHGAFAIMTYATSIMTQVGVSVNPELQSLLVPLCLLCGSVAPILFVDRTGRKPLLIGAFSVSAVSLSCLASALLMQRSGVVVPSWVPVVTIAAAVFSYSAGVVPIPNIIINDMFQFQVRGKIIGLILMVYWGCTSLQVVFFELISSALGLDSVFFMSAAINIFGALLVLIFIPETKGKTTEQIEDILAGKRSGNTLETTSS